MKVKRIIIDNETGLHARPATEIVKLASKFNSNVYLKIGDKKINAKSPLEIMAAGIKTKTEIDIQTEGEDEEEALEEISNLIENKLGE